MSWEVWITLPVYVKLILFGVCASTIVVMARCVRLGRKVFFYGQPSPRPEAFSNGEVPPDVLARYALAHASPPYGRSEQRLRKRYVVDSEPRNVAQGMWSARFAYLCDECSADVVAIRTSARLTILTAIFTILY